MTEEEKEGRRKVEEEKKTAENQKKEEEEKEKQAAYDALDEMGKINANWARKIDVVHKDAAARLKLNRLNKAEKKELFHSIRYSFVKHEDLIALTTNKTFEMAKDYIVEGLSVRLNPFESCIKTDLKINTEPRSNKDPNEFMKAETAQQQAASNNSAMIDKAHPNPYLRKTNFDNYYERKLHEERQGHQELTNKLLMGRIQNEVGDMMG